MVIDHQFAFWPYSNFFFILPLNLHVPCFSRSCTSINSMWPALRTRLVRQKAISPNDVFSNLLASRPDDVKDCLILPDLMLTSTPSTAKCNPRFSAMNCLKCNLRTIWSQNTLSDLMQMHSSGHAIKAYRPHSAISNWFSGAKEAHTGNIQINFRYSHAVSKFLMMFIPGTSFMLAVQTRKWTISYSSMFNCFIVNTLGKLLKALSNINWQCFASLD